MPADVQQLIAAVARANATWGEERIAAEVRLKLGLCVSPRTVRRYMPQGRGPRNRVSSQRWSTFVRNHASAMLACDFFVTITAKCRTLYVFVVLDVGTRRFVHWNVTEHPTAAWTVQQFRSIVPGDQRQRFLIHDRDSIYAAGVDGAVGALGLTVLKTPVPVRCPQANAFRERLIGTVRRECLDWLSVLSERQLRFVLQEWWLTTTTGGHTPASVRAYRTCRSTGSRDRTAIRFLMATESSPPRSWRGCTTNTAWNHWRHEPKKGSRAPWTMIAEHRGPYQLC